MLKDVDLFREGPDLLVGAIKCGNAKIAEMFIQRGVPCDTPPETASSDKDYRKSPYIIQAASQGNWEIV